MKRKLILLTIPLLVVFYGHAQSVISGDLPLYNVVTGNETTIGTFESHTAVVLIFTSIHCPYAKLYKKRIAALSDQYTDQNVRFVLINANNAGPSKKETIAEMKTEAGSLRKQVPYFVDKKRVVKNTLKVEKNPEVIILKPAGKGFRKVYQGAIDDSPQSESNVSNNYVKMALEDLLKKQPITIAYQRPVGCMIR